MVVTMGRMYDSTTAADIPADAQIVGGYIDGAPGIVWAPADWDRFPGARKVRIATSASTADGDMIDVEQGDATPAQAVQWVQQRRAAGHTWPTVYVATSQWSAVRDAFTAAGVAQPLYIVAQWDNDPTIPAGAAGKQYAHPPASGGHFDLTATVDSWPPAPAPPPDPRPEVHTDVLCIVYFDDGAYIVNLTTWTRRGIPDQDDETALSKVLPVVPLTDALKSTIQRVG